MLFILFESCLFGNYLFLPRMSFLLKFSFVTLPPWNNIRLGCILLLTTIMCKCLRFKLFIFLSVHNENLQQNHKRSIPFLVCPISISNQETVFGTFHKTRKSRKKKVFIFNLFLTLYFSVCPSVRLCENVSVILSNKKNCPKSFLFFCRKKFVFANSLEPSAHFCQWTVNSSNIFGVWRTLVVPLLNVINRPFGISVVSRIWFSDLSGPKWSR